MPTTDDKAAQDKANLTRIRENQRRSRARRKEYLQELEQRIRVYEQQGIEASTEIQQAARKVAEENRKLRALLTQQGVDESSIESYLHSPNATPAHGLSAAAGESVSQVLDHLLASRHPSFDSTGTSLTQATGLDPVSRRSSASYGAGALTSQSSHAHLALSMPEVQQSAAIQTYGSLVVNNDTQGFSAHVMSGFVEDPKQGFDVRPLPLQAESPRPTMHLSRQAVSDPTGMWTEAPQISPISSIPLHDNQNSQSHTYMERPVQLSQRRAHTYSATWSTQLDSGQDIDNSGMLDNGFTPLAPGNHPQQNGFPARVQENGYQELADTSQQFPESRESPKHDWNQNSKSHFVKSEFGFL
ncbi:hypothetical protein PFICI_05151 [Pestalotiopsis fici W106-1]|uniref:BZIP domain-containing protein n=1 Tax=Pestalotiopsis fici (strain W106-1 / CGMCC3.15140) TaxID=1229662 RepID=W3XB65_PESFW|nr:uncharacterized protein PFICI_05151 [Pestalotiopsis fici W106-1]ETS83275.1 hypothetical protein PFICI_05151 [Pestalotiopsis fici W106-1]